ncbi:UvrD-helicase domain-containing protein [Ramlibacter algicola]|uniref:DNA 3'-5' helicase n=1 Tax=Ramlibacter algicola TaxID=2795217 RepID=A0A934US74_9BURK|nr:UvrD-helicase domain-containing protein [Ramlibacter algicola]MBK0393581.1 UvrD-helicase domain-containing protein [Ramlibacter algicola]
MTEALAYEVDGRRVDAAAFYAIACDPRRSVAVEACAGAGKTWMLVSRIVRALLEGVQPHEVLAITFTKKAAGEMRQRLQEWLAEFALAGDEHLDTALLARGVAPADVARLREPLRTLHARVLEGGRGVQIRTFHSWFAALLRHAPLATLEAMGLPASYTLLEDDSQAVDAVWRRFHLAVAADAQARADYEAGVAACGRFMLSKALHAALSKRVEFALADRDGVVEASVEHWHQRFPEFAAVDEPRQLLALATVRQAWLPAAAALGRASAPTFSACGSQLEQAIGEGNLDVALQALLTQKLEPRKFNDKLAGIEHVRGAQSLALRICEAVAQHEAWLHHTRLARLTRLLLAEYAALKREEGWVDMADVEQAAHRLLSDPVLAGWVQEGLDARVRHLLVDEFQDTNPLQWQAMHAWLGSYAGAGHAPGVFLVGDPKQSIYRFRRAEPQVFAAAQRFVVEGLGGQRLSCDHTRRNAPVVLAAVNSVLGTARDAGEYAGFRDHSTASNEQGVVRSLPVIPRPEATVQAEADDTWRDSLAIPRETPEERLVTLECRQAARWIAQRLAGGLEPSQLLVLARRRDRLSALEAELRELRIPAQQPEKTRLGEAPEVQDLVALVDVLVSPTHDLSLARALKSPLFGVDDAALAQIAVRARANAAGGRRPWLELLQAETDWPAGLAAAAASLARWHPWVRSLPPHDALHAIYHDGDVPARFARAAPPALRDAVLANVQALPAAALELEGGRFATPYAFVRALRAGQVQGPGIAATDAVRLLTVHGAKGLEAPVVLLLDTDGAPPPAETMTVLVDWPGEAEGPRRFTFLASESRSPACNVQALAVELDARRREELNALYVAMTRAQRELVLSSIEPYRAAAGSWWQRVSPLAQAVDVGPELPQGASTDQHFTMPVLPRVDLPIPPVRDTGSDASRLGELLHRLLEWHGAGVALPSGAALARAARPFRLDAPQAARARAMAQAILAGEGAWAWDPAHVAWAGDEVELVHAGEVLRLDRLVRHHDGRWWVLDHKSAAHPERDAALQAQLRRYVAAIQALHPGDEVLGAFLTGDGRLVTLV